MSYVLLQELVALVAQLDRASGYGPEGRGFEFLRAHFFLRIPVTLNGHEKWMRLALDEAEKAYQKQEVPVGAVVICENEVVGKGHNLIETLQDPTAHAEMLALQTASQKLASWRLEKVILYTTLEPCPMCAGAILISRVPLVVFGAKDFRMGACGSAINICQTPDLDVGTKFVGGILEQTCSDLLKMFFKNLRKSSK